VKSDPNAFDRFHRCLAGTAVCAIILLGVTGRASGQDVPASGKTGIRTISSDRLTLVTDLPPSPQIDALPRLFDEALTQWCDYFGVDLHQHADWRVTGALIGAKARWQASRRLPDDLPDFRTGWSRGREFWLYDQTSAYYRRHLLLHEGVHCLMNDLLGYRGPAWYAEGMAEMLATHRIVGGEIRVNYFPQSPAEVDRLGRIEIVQTALRERRGMTLPKIFAYDSRAHSQNEPYGWCWAAAEFLQRHPAYRQRFATIKTTLNDTKLNERLKKLYAQDWDQLLEEWQAYVGSLEYGYDFERTAIDFAPGKPIAGEAKLTVTADRGWQNTGLRLQAGKTYHLHASGRYQVGNQPRPWLCEPGGVTIRYYQGKPLGILLAAVRQAQAKPNSSSAFLKPIIVGLGADLQPRETGTLYLRINDSAGELAENTGSASVTVNER
jgi:hypothetical protein